MRPNDVAMDGEGNLWVVGWTNSADHDFAVQYNKQGRVLRKFDLQKTGWVRGVAVDTRRNHILITQATGDEDNLHVHGKVLVFRPDGTLLRTVGQQQGMKRPRYITVDGEGNILVSDWDNHCVYVYNEDGQFLFQFGGEGSGKGQLKYPRGICTDRAGNIIVADERNSRVEMFDKTGKFLKHIATDMKGLQAVAMATQGQLVITDCGHHKVSIFQNIYSSDVTGLKNSNKMTTAPSSLGTHFKEELSCSICLELFTRPKVLPCQHTFCQDCLQDHAGRGGTFQCPICRRQVRLPRQGVAGLPDNLMAANMCERFQQQATLSGETREQQSQSANRCSSHPSEDLKVFCTQCQVRVCDQCLEETHDGHGTTSLKKAAQERSSTVQPLINEGRNIVESYLSFLRSLREEEKTLNKKKQQRDNSIIQAYNQMVQKLTQRKDHLLSESEENHTKNLDRMQTERDRVLADINELSAACDRAEQELQQGWVQFLSQQTALTEVVRKYRRKAAPTPVQTQPAVFQPTDTPVPVLGHVTVQSLPSAPIPAAPAARGRGHHHGNQRQGERQPQKVTFGGVGSGTGQFNDPWGVAVSDEGDIFVADTRNQRIQVFTLQGTFVRQFPTVVSGAQKMYPHDVAMDGEGNLWVVGDIDTHFAVQYNKQGRVLRKIDLQKTGWARGVAVDTRRNHILITQSTGDWDNPHGEVLVFRPDGTLVRTVGQQRGMKFPRYITVDGEGNILVSDWGNHCVYVYNKDGQFLFNFGGEGGDEGQLNTPQGICTDRAGNIIVADKGNRRVEMFDKTGKFLKHIPTGHLWTPWAVAMATQGQLVITDFRDNTVSMFQNI
ncbi:tripartite motif-containing protein 2-like [Branchiostoma floridae x Branchiostoma belcheri]